MNATLNLVRPENSAINYKIIPFSDGQQDLTIEIPDSKYDSVEIISRFNSFRDLELIIIANRILRSRLKIKEVSLTIPYLLGARSDRRFADGGIGYLKEVVAPIINVQKFDNVTVLDPHSDIAEALIDNLVKINNFELIDFALDYIWDDEKDEHAFYANKTAIISPDGGALKKIYDVAKQFSIPTVIEASKHRDITTGKITHTTVPLTDEHTKIENFIIIDDICDGGRTFVEAAKVIKAKFKDAKIYLIVTHGIFSAKDEEGILQPFRELSKYFTKIFTTNSVKDLPTYSWDIGMATELICLQLDIFNTKSL